MLNFSFSFTNTMQHDGKERVFFVVLRIFFRDALVVFRFRFRVCQSCMSVEMSVSFVAIANVEYLVGLSFKSKHFVFCFIIFI